MTSDRVTDKQTGISLRFIKEYDATTDTLAPSGDSIMSMSDWIWALAFRDERDISFMQKLVDARDFVRRQIQ